ncbi:hypothetical protein [Flavicella sp.]|uniref:hypothetical protein n=1 Tax=Flavicella sp. TaxID=2957742 RepID=UPI002616729F|nr:hypothetical protein [Flavicella sp.]MDG1803943.1 hypothetical protein [Flavicella sp.]MDG2280934.1 hypothetical protein [Flavicella sp.]
MTLEQATIVLEKLILETEKKSYLRTLKKFSYLITALKKREFSEDEIATIEKQLALLETDKSPKFYRSQLQKFQSFLKSNFSLVTKNYYTELGTALGLSFGVALGTSVLSHLEISNRITFGMLIGMVAGMGIGKYLDQKAQNESRVL